jgi:hypothetical protein
VELKSCKQNKPGSERQILHVISHIHNLDLKKKIMESASVGKEKGESFGG